MKRWTLAVLAIFMISLNPGCRPENTELKAEAQQQADAMCRSMEVMQALKSTAPADSARVDSLQKASEALSAELQELHGRFLEKYRDKMAEKPFSDEFAAYLNEAMLNCPHLTAEDRALFERRVGR